jgi:hypothetical protein
MPKAKRMAFADRIALAGVAIGLSGAVAALAFPLAFPDLVSVQTWRVVLLGSLVILFIAVGRLVYDVIREIKTARRVVEQNKLLGYIGAASTIVLIGTWYFWPQDPMDRRLPGFGGYAVLRIFDDPDFRRKYVFNVGSDDGAKVSFYISAADMFTLSATDVHGEPYTVEIPISSNKIPLHDFMALFCEVGVTEENSILRIDVNGREILRRTLPFVINLGSRKWKNTSIGGGSFRFVEFGIWGETFSNEKIKLLVDNVRGAFHLPLK